jgi:hypothetical protein
LHPASISTTVAHPESDARDTTQETSVDFSLIQALQETRELAASHEGEPGWDRVQARVERLLDRLTIEVDDVAVGEGQGGIDRIDRELIDQQAAERAVAALLAVADRTVGDELDLADEALEDLEDAIG